MDEKMTEAKTAEIIESKDFIAKCKTFVKNYYDNITEEDVFVVWYCKTLQNHKAILATNIKEDSSLYEITYNGILSEFYIDRYYKMSNVAIPLE